MVPRAIQVNHAQVATGAGPSLATGDKIALSCCHDKLLTADSKGSLFWNAEATGDSEKWTVIKHGDGSMSLQSAHGLFLCSEPNGQLIANREAVGEWEKFRPEDNGHGAISLQSSHGFYLSAQPDGKTDHRTEAREWEHFQVIRLLSQYTCEPPVCVPAGRADDIEQQVIDAVLRESLEAVSSSREEGLAVGGACADLPLVPAPPASPSNLEVRASTDTAFVLVERPGEQPKTSKPNVEVTVEVCAPVKTAVATETSPPFVSMGGAGGTRGSAVSAPIQALPTSLNAVEVWARLWSKELELLAAMGFTDVPALLELLRQHVEVPCSLRPELNGEPAQDGMQRVVAALLSC